MKNLDDQQDTTDAWSGPIYSDINPPIALSLTVTDPEMVAALSAHPEGRRRDEFALTALRIGIMAIKQAQGRIDGETVKAEGERIVSELETRLAQHRESVTGQITNSLKEYFDPRSGRFNERLERLLRQDGELEEVLRRQIASDGSELAGTLAKHVGDTSPLMKMLDPNASTGLLAALRQNVDDALKQQRDRILQQFSLDDGQSALSRLVRELTDTHGMFTENLQGSVKAVVGEFSLDNEQSALSRLVRRVETAQKQISSEFSLDAETSALARLKREMLEVLDGHKKQTAEFQQEVREALAEMKARREEAKRSTTHGHDFEEELFRVVQRQCHRAGHIAQQVGATTGIIRNSKVGDITIELSPEHVAAGARIVVEAKEDASYDLSKARAEIDIGRKNRQAEVGVFVFSRDTAPASVEPFARFGNDIFVIWDANDATSDVFLDAAVSVAYAMCSRAAASRETQKADFESLERAIREIEKQIQGFDEITRSGETIKNSSDKILNRARIMKDAVGKQLRVLDEMVGDLKELLGDEHAPVSDF